jgi:ATP-dependent exoDNAse (exonuclease V) beta subunit
MTIHRSKGLEFDHVFVPCLDRDLNRGREPLLRWLDLPRSQGGSDLIMAPVPAVSSESGGGRESGRGADRERVDVGSYLKRLIWRRAANERTRLLYVAATRSKRTLYLSASPKPKQDGTVAPRTGTLLACLWPALGGATDTSHAGGREVERRADRERAMRAQRNDFRASAELDHAPADESVAPGPEVSTSDAAPTRPLVIPLRRLIPNWALPDPDATPERPRLPIAHQSVSPPEFSWVGETRRHIGTVVHAALEGLAKAPRLPPPSWAEGQRNVWLNQLRRHGVPEPDLPGAAADVVEALKRTVSDERGRWIFSAEHREARSEFALTGIAGGRLTNVIIDRSFIDRDGTRWVIDFKTSRHEGGGLDTFLEHEMDRYRAQLESYVALARALGANPVRAGLYFPLLGIFRELTG